MDSPNQENNKTCLIHQPPPLVPDPHPDHAFQHLLACGGMQHLDRELVERWPRVDPYQASLKVPCRIAVWSSCRHLCEGVQTACCNIIEHLLDSGSRVPATTEQVGNIGTQLFLSRRLSRPGPPPILQHGACYELRPKELCEQVAMPGLKRPLLQVEPIPDIHNSQQAHFHSPIEDTHSLTCNLPSSSALWHA